MSKHNQNLALSILNELKQNSEITEDDFKKMSKNLKKQNKKENKLEKGLRLIAFLKMDEMSGKLNQIGSIPLTFDDTQKGFFHFFDFLNTRQNRTGFSFDENLKDFLSKLKDQAKNVKLNNDFHIFAKKNYQFSNKKLPFLRILSHNAKMHFFKNGLKKLDEKTIRLNFYIENQKENFKHYDLNLAIELYKKGLSFLMMDSVIDDNEGELPNEVHIELEKLFHFSYLSKLAYALICLSEIRKFLKLTDNPVTMDEIHFLKNFIEELYFVNAEMNDHELKAFIPLFTLKEDNSLDLMFEEEIVKENDLLNEFKRMFKKH